MTALRYQGGAFEGVELEDIDFAKEFFSDQDFVFATSLMHLILCATPREDKWHVTREFFIRIEELSGVRKETGKALLNVLIIDLVDQMDSLINNCPESIKESHVLHSKKRTGLEIKSIEDVGYLETIDALLGVHTGLQASYRIHWYEQVQKSSDPRYDNLPYWRKERIHKEWEKRMESNAPIVMLGGLVLAFIVISIITQLMYE